MPNKPLRMQHRSSTEWKGIISDYESSNMSASEYCLHYNLTRSVFGKWKGKFAKSKPGKFIPLSRMEDPSTQSLSFSSSVKISISDKFSLEFSSGCNLEELSQMIRVVQKCC